MLGAVRRSGTVLWLIFALASGGCAFTQSWGDFEIGGDAGEPPMDAGPGMDAGDSAVDSGPGMDADSTDAGGDTCSEETSSSTGTGVFQGDTIAATQRLTPSCTPGGDTAPDRQYAWTAPAAGYYRFTTEGSSYDTILSLQASCDGMELACNDDAPDTPGTWSRLSIQLDAGQTVIVNVDGYNGGTGNFEVNVLEGGCGDGTVQIDHETCDDGNTSNGDGCSDACRVEQIEGALRIVDGPDASEGRLEVFHMGMWGTVCDDPQEGGLWDTMMVNADVACRQLGFTSGVAIAADATVDGSEPTWLDEVVCAGTEARLVDCQCGGVFSCGSPANICTMRWGCENCGHTEDIGVDCTP